MQLPFTKMNGAGNDFVMIDNRDGRHTLNGAQIARLCDRHRGIGADGLLAVEPAQNGADFRMRYYNADGGEAEMCGNGARCFGRFAARLSGTSDSVSFETIAGVITAHFSGELVTIQMSEPKNLQTVISVHAAGETLIVHSVNTGVPHAIVPVADIEAVDVRTLGAALRYHEHFAPQGTNVNFVQALGEGALAIRTYERGVEDETLACGTGVVAAAVIQHHLSDAPTPIKVRVRGGDDLEVGFERDGDRYCNVTLRGPADFVFSGSIEI